MASRHDRTDVGSAQRETDEIPTARPDRDRRHRLVATFDVAEFRLLERTASGFGLRPAALASLLVSKGLRSDIALSFDVENLRRQVDVVSDDLRAVEVRLDRLESASSGRPSETVAAGVGRPRRRRGQADEPPRARLHEEIAAVLRETGGPMTSAQIAERIRQRGLFEPPRSKRKLDVLMVASRISHENYRHLFSREGGRVRLAEDGD